MSEKISDNDLRKLIDECRNATPPKNQVYLLLDIIEKHLDIISKSSGIFEPEEDQLEKARNAWKHAPGIYGEDRHLYFLSMPVKRYISALEAAITRLKASAWTEEEVADYREYCLYKLGHGYGILGPTEWLLQCRSGKWAE